jgi:hypothetical protein
MKSVHKLAIAMSAIFGIAGSTCAIAQVVNEEGQANDEIQASDESQVNEESQVYDGVEVQAPAVTPTPLTLINGWTNAPAGTNTASIEKINGIVQFRGAIATSGTNPVAFVLPDAFRPTTTVYAKVALCKGANGRLMIQPDGTTMVQVETDFAFAQCFTSLDGASFAPLANAFTDLVLENGWVGAEFGTSAPAAHKINGIVHLKGSISTGGTNTEPFVLPAAFRAKTTVYVPVDMCGATNGRLIVSATGDVTVQAETNFANAQCFTSLDGVSYNASSASFQNLALINGWTNSVFSSTTAGVVNIGGVVRFKGSISTTAKNSKAFVLPAAFRPAKATYVAIDMCNATHGQLDILPSGAVFVQAETKFANAQCFTSLDGASFVK